MPGTTMPAPDSDAKGRRAGSERMNTICPVVGKFGCFFLGMLLSERGVVPVTSVGEPLSRVLACVQNAPPAWDFLRTRETPGRGRRQGLVLLRRWLGVLLLRKPKVEVRRRDAHEQCVSRRAGCSDSRADGEGVSRDGRDPRPGNSAVHDGHSRGRSDDVCFCAADSPPVLVLSLDHVDGGLKLHHLGRPLPLLWAVPRRSLYSQSNVNLLQSHGRMGRKDLVKTKRGRRLARSTAAK